MRAGFIEPGLMPSSTLARQRLVATILIPCLLMSGTALAAPQLTEHEESLSALNNFHNSAVSLAGAIADVEAKTGGKVINIRFKDVDGTPSYQAVVVTPNDVGLAQVNARSGHVSGLDRKISDRSLKWEQRNDLKSFAEANTPLSKAIAKAERLAGGPAVNAGLAKSLTPNNDVLAYNIEVLKLGQVQRIAVDATTGEVIADPDTLGLGDRDPEEFLAIAPQ
jgi:uncharacterized membrane protein YkoI